MKRAALGSAVFFVVAPGTMAGLVPWLLTGWRHPHGVNILDVVGILLVVAGLTLAAAAFVQFVIEGRGTPAPVAPTQELVVGGLYRHMRNPMYVAVATMIGGQALFFRSIPLLVWAVAFVVATASFVRFYEEPTLRRTYGEAYEQYRRAVPGWWPRRHAWHP